MRAAPPEVCAAGIAPRFYRGGGPMNKLPADLLPPRISLRNAAWSIGQLCGVETGASAGRLVAESKVSFLRFYESFSVYR